MLGDSGVEVEVGGDGIGCEWVVGVCVMCD